METTIPTGKTSRPDVYLEHVGVAVQRFPTLYEHYKQERFSRWKTYVKEQKALHKLCMRVKGNPKLKKENVVVAFGAAMFRSSMRGKRAVPVKRFLEHLRKYVTVVLTSEHYTSQKCSHGCGPGSGKQPKKKGQRTKRGRPKKKRAPKPPRVQPVRAPQSVGAQPVIAATTATKKKYVLTAVRGERRADGTAGPLLYPIRICVICRTIWNRDVNAARNIARMFFHQMNNANEKPPWAQS